MKRSNWWLRVLLLGATAAAVGPALADITIGVDFSLTGPGSALGIPMKNSIGLWPEQIAGQKLRVIVLDDATDPSQATRNARKLATEDKVDLIVGSSSTPAALAVASVAEELGVVQLAAAPIDLPAGKDHWVFRLPQRIGLMADALVDDMKKRRVATLGFIGFNDPWGEVWLKEITRGIEGSPIRIVDVERYNRPDTSVTGQVLKLLAAHPDAILVAGAGTGAALPQVSLVDKGYRGQIYQTHGAASRDIMRIGGKAMDGAIIPVGPVLVAEQLPNSHPSKQVALEHVQQYESKYGKDSRSPFAAHSADAALLLARIVPVALKSASPGTPEFRSALRDALESQGNLVGTQGVFNYSASDHFGLDERGRVLARIEGGEWKLLK